MNIIRLIPILLITLFLIGCSSQDHPGEEQEDMTKEETEAITEENDAEVEESKEEELELFEITSIDDLKIKEKKLNNLYDDDRNFPAHTEKEIMMEYADDDGFIDFSLEDQPVRNITSEDGNINNITNYSDTFIEITDEVAFIFPEKHIEKLYEIVISQPTDMIVGYDGDGEIDFRSFEELTNLERAILSSIGMTGPLLNLFDEMVKVDTFDDEAFEVITEQFKKLGSPTLLIPAPQSLTDYELFNIMLVLKEDWMQLGNYEDFEEEADEIIDDYTQLREDTNNLFAYLFITIGGIE